jgi:hypothetical protein
MATAIEIAKEIAAWLQKTADSPFGICKDFLRIDEAVEWGQRKADPKRSEIAVRDWGNWIPRPGEQDDDHKALSHASAMKLHMYLTSELSNKYPRFAFQFSAEEKQWITIYVQEV